MIELLSRDHRILEKGLMEFRPFGVDAGGRKIRDVSGMTIRANADYLEEAVSRMQGPEAGARAVEELCRRLNERIHDPAYHVTPAFLKNMWHSYSYEFTCFLGEFCEIIAGDPQFAFKMAKEKFLSPIIQTLGRPFTVPQIYKMFPHFGEKFVKGSVHLEAGPVTDHHARLRMQFTDAVCRQFGPYRKACAALACQSSKGGLAAVPERIHHGKPAMIKDLTCIAEGDDWCEWDITWETAASSRLLTFWKVRHEKTREREQLIDEQLRSVEARHEELREAYLEQEQATVELRRKVAQLTTLHRAGLLFGSTLDRETLLQTVLEALIHDLHYDRAMISLYDPGRQVSYGFRVLGASEEIAALVRTLEIPVTDCHSIEGTVLRKGQPVLVGDVRMVWDFLHPLNRHLASIARAKSIISVPLKVKGRILGALTVDRLQEHSLTQEDLDLMVTMANQVAVALDNVEAYSQIEQLNVGLETKVRERTIELEGLNRDLQAANEKLRELDQLKSAFVSIVSHEFRTPMTSIKGCVENLLDGLGGPLTERQALYLERLKYNAERLTRMSNELLDLSRIEAGKIEFHASATSLVEVVGRVIESLQAIAQEKAVAIRQRQDGQLPLIQADPDKLHQILTNLIHNAVKFSPRHSEILVEGRRRDDGSVQVCVADQGPGIPPEELDKVFDKFYRGESAPVEARGAGLGLAITKTLVELHGGRIWAESTSGQGTRFFFTLPIAHQHTEEERR